MFLSTRFSRKSAAFVTRERDFLEKCASLYRVHNHQARPSYFVEDHRPWNKRDGARVFIPVSKVDACLVYLGYKLSTSCARASLLRKHGSNRSLSPRRLDEKYIEPILRTSERRMDRYEKIIFLNLFRLRSILVDFF